MVTCANVSAAPASKQLTTDLSDTMMRKGEGENVQGAVLILRERGQ